MYRSAGVNPCLAPGEVGIGSGISSDGPGPKVEQIECRPAGFLFDVPAVKIDDVTVDNVVVSNGSSEDATITGTLNNRSANVLSVVNVYFFAMDGSRPIANAMATADADVAPGAHWDFSTLVHGPVPAYKVFAE